METLQEAIKYLVICGASGYALIKLIRLIFTKIKDLFK